MICNCINEAPDKINWLSVNGFVENENIKGVYYKDETISGIRFWYNQYDQSKIKKINNPIKITVERDYSAGETLIKTALSPVTLVLDAAEYAFYGSVAIAIYPIIAISEYVTDTGENEGVDNK